MRFAILVALIVLLFWIVFRYMNQIPPSDDPHGPGAGGAL